MTTNHTPKGPPPPHIETRVELLEHTVGDMKRVLTKMDMNLSEFVKTQGKPFELRGFMTTIAITISIVVAAFAFLDNRYVPSGHDAANDAVLRYRVQQIEAHERGYVTRSELSELKELLRSAKEKK